MVRNNSKKVIRRKSNKGSTMLIVLVTVTFLGILGAVALYSAYANYVLKQYDTKNKQTFYTAESVVEEIYTGMGMKAMDTLSDSYTYVLSNPTGGVLNVEYGNSQKNKLMRQKYIQLFMENYGGKDAGGVPYYSWADALAETNELFTAGDGGAGDAVCNNIMAMLNSTIKDPTSASVNSVSAVTVQCKGNPDPAIKNDCTGYTILIEDANIRFKQKAGHSGVREYFSEVTVDLVLGMPNMEVVFNVEKGKILDSFKDYVFVGMQSVQFKSVSAGVNAGIFAGHTPTGGGIIINDATVNMNNSVVATSGNINISNSASTSVNVKFAGSSIWANNIFVTSNVKKPTANNATLIIDGNSSTHLSDDLQVDTHDSKTEVSGDFWGYGTGGMGHGGSSAVILNGKRSSINLSNLKNLLINGNAYVCYNTTSTLTETGESLGLKGNQRYYMPLDSYVEAFFEDASGNRYDTASPSVTVNSSMPMNNVVHKNIVFYVPGWTFNGAEVVTNYGALENFFGKDFLSPTQPIITKDAGSFTYAFYNFKNNEARNEYLKCLLDGAYFASKFPGASAQVKSSYTEAVANTKKYLKSVDSLSAISVAAGAKVYAPGLLLQYVPTTDVVSGGSSNTDGSTLQGALGDGKVDYAGITANQLFATNMEDNFENRFEIINHMLYVSPEVDASGKFIIQNKKPSAVSVAGVDYKVPDGTYDRNAFENIVDMDYFNGSEYVGRLSGSCYVAAVNGDVIIPAEAKYGVVIAGGNVTVQGDFQGLILSQSNIYVSSGIYGNNLNGASGGTYGNLQEFCENYDGGVLTNYIRAYQGTFNFGNYDGVDEAEQNKISKIRYTDLVSYTNWRKTDGE